MKEFARSLSFRWCATLLLLLSFHSVVAKADNNLNLELLLATRNDNLEKVVKLLDQGADPTAQVYSEQGTPIWTTVHDASFIAAYNGKNRVFKELIRRGVNFNFVAEGQIIGYTRTTPLGFVLNITSLNFGKQAEVESVVIEMANNGANFFYPNERSTPLNNAFRYGLKNVIAKVDSNNIPRDSLLWVINDLMLDYKYGDSTKIRAYITEFEVLFKKYDIGIYDWGFYAPDKVSGKPILTGGLAHRAIRERDVTLVEFLKQRGFDVNAPMGSFGSACEAAYISDESWFDLLIQLGCNRFSNQQMGVVLRGKLYSVAEKMLSFGVDLNAPYDFYQGIATRTLLIDFCRARDADLLESAYWLIDHGADVNLKAPNGELPLHALALIFIENGEDYQKRLKLLEAMIKHGLDVDARRFNQTVLTRMANKFTYIDYSSSTFSRFLATLSYHIDVAKILLKAGADPDLFDGDSSRSPLTYAASGPYFHTDYNVEFIHLLLKRKADPTAGARDHVENILHGLARHCKTSVCMDLFEAVLRKSGSIINYKDRSPSYGGRTPLCIAKDNNNSIAVQKLLKFGADESTQCD